MFSDRVSAGRLLAPPLAHLRAKHPVVLALPRGGVPVAAAVAEALDAPLDLILVRKIGAPYQPELAIGAIGEGPTPLVELDQGTIAALGVPSDYVAAEEAEQRRELERRQLAYRGSRPPLELAGRTVILIDDGIATGATMRVAIAAARLRKAASVVVAVPVAAPEAAAELAVLADEVVCLETPKFLYGVGAHYGDFTQVTDAEVTACLAARRSARSQNPQA
jgi:putative phosphoribosyl transferase